MRLGWFHVQVVWGKISMVDAEKRLLANALKDTDNQHFVLLSDRCHMICHLINILFTDFLPKKFWFNFLARSCIPLHDFDYVFNYLMYTNISFVDWWVLCLVICICRRLFQLFFFFQNFYNCPRTHEINAMKMFVSDASEFVWFYWCMHLILSSFEDPGPHGSGRYSEHMLPEVEKNDFRKGAQVNLSHLMWRICRIYQAVKTSIWHYHHVERLLLY